MSDGSAALSLGLVERLRRYSRYTALIAEQLDALQEDDAERLRRTLELRSALEGEMAQTTGETRQTIEGDDTSDVPEEFDLQSLHDDLCTALLELEERYDADRSTEEQWTLISEGAIKSARTVPTARLAARAYPDFGIRPTNLDRRF